MKRLLILSIVLTIAGIGLILFSDPVLTAATGGSPIPITNGHGPVTINGTSSNGNSNFGGLPPGCHQSGNGVICGTSSAGGITDSVIITIAGIGLCGAGLFLTAIETIAKPTSPYQIKAVT